MLFLCFSLGFARALFSKCARCPSGTIALLEGKAIERGEKRIHGESKARMSGVEKRRPLSPHLQVYRPMLTMMMSIAHRITGAALYVGILLLAWFLVAASIGGKTFETAAHCFNSIPGRVILFGFTWALFHHLLGGMRHIIWDAGYGFEAKEREWLAQATLFGGVALTATVWVMAYLIQ
jgi:succinate dehydrogenase / fumarate reductase, cytochrome b subunit